MAILGWLKHLFHTKPRIQVSNSRDLSESVPQINECLSDDFAERIASLEQERKALLDGFHQDSVNHSKRHIPKYDYTTSVVIVKQFSPYVISDIKTMTQIMSERVDNEKYKLRQLRQSVTIHLAAAKDYLGESKYAESEKELKIAAELMPTAGDPDIALHYETILSDLNRAVYYLNLKRQMEEAKRRKEEERSRKEIAELWCKLKQSNMAVKPGFSSILELFSQNGVAYLYHFTSVKNIRSIKENNGLIAPAWHAKLGINVFDAIDYEYKDSLPLEYDRYVKLSICRDHYLAYSQRDNGVDVCILKIKTDVIKYSKTRFVDRDTHDAACHIGGEVQDADKFDFREINKLHGNVKGPSLKYAEVLVDSFIPSELIVNLDNPQKLR